jgi:hypothetical protein
MVQMAGVVVHVLRHASVALGCTLKTTDGWERSYPAVGVSLVRAILGSEVELESRCFGDGRVVY